MRRREVLGSLAALGALAAAPRVLASAPAGILQSAAPAAHPPTANAEKTVQQTLARIAALDRSGPHLNSVIELNPDALQIARRLDRQARAGAPSGALQGIPILLKDNIATGDRMSTTAGSLALDGIHAQRDAALVARLRAAGAVVVGKTNLSEWANFRSTRATSGWSGRGGITLNPYALDRSPSGSSSGSAVAVAAGLVDMAVGSETDGSIVSPASINGCVGLKPTVGRISRDGIVPISKTQDTAGPIARSVTDAARLLGVLALASPDPRDPATANAPAPADYVAALDPHALRGARLGVARNYFTGHDEVDAQIERALAVLKAQGAELIDVTDLAKVDYADAETTVMLYEFKDGLPRWLAEFAPHAPVRTVADVIAFDNAHRPREMPYFAQELLIQAEATQGGLIAAPYRNALAACAKHARDEGLARALRMHRLDALIAPTGGTAWMVDMINGDASGDGFTTPAAVAGFPHLTVPAGLVRGLPVGLSFVGPAWSEARLLALGFAFEQATQWRRPPRYLAHTAIPPLTPASPLSPG